MKYSKIWLIALILLSVLSGCIQPTGNASIAGLYTCEQGEVVSNTRLCPENQKEIIQEITRYQCEDGSVVDDISICSIPKPTLKYQCSDGNIMDTPDECPKLPFENVKERLNTELNKKIDVGDFAISVVDISKTDNFDGKDATGIFINIGISIENIGNEPNYLIGSYFTLIDDRGRKFEPVITHKPYSKIQPGLSAIGDIVFDVPDDLKKATFKIEDVEILVFDPREI